MAKRLFGTALHASVVALAVTELLLFAAALLGASYLRLQPGAALLPWQLADIQYVAVAFAVLLFVCCLALGLYTHRQRANAAGVLLRVLLAGVCTTVLMSLAIWLLPWLPIGYRELLAAVLLSVLFSLYVRVLFTALGVGDVFRRRVLVYGAGARALTFQQLRRASDRRSFKVVGYVCPPGESAQVPQEQLLDASQGLLALSQAHGVEEIVVALEDRRLSLPVDELLACRMAGIVVSDYVTFMEGAVGRIVLEALNPSWLIFASGFRQDPLRRFMSRAMDIAVSLLLLVTTLPLWLLSLIAIRIEDGWHGADVVFRQQRVGLGGVPYTLYKLRSMSADAEKAGAQWAQKNDPRVTRVGAFMRKTRIDELPQLYNVLRGDMSLVGPRPERPEFVSTLQANIPFYAQRHAVKPGIAGWAQLCYPYGASEADALQKLQYDLYYVKNNTFLLDLSILVQTAEVVLMGKGAR